MHRESTVSVVVAIGILFLTLDSQKIYRHV